MEGYLHSLNNSAFAFFFFLEFFSIMQLCAIFSLVILKTNRLTTSIFVKDSAKLNLKMKSSARPVARHHPLPTPTDGYALSGKMFFHIFNVIRGHLEPIRASFAAHKPIGLTKDLSRSISRHPTSRPNEIFCMNFMY